MPAKNNRMFAVGEKVRVAKKSHVIDRERANEGLADDDRIPIEQDVTGYEGEVCSQPYDSPMKDGTSCVPIRLPNDAVIGVPEDRVERVGEGGGIIHAAKIAVSKTLAALGVAGRIVYKKNSPKNEEEE